MATVQEVIRDSRAQLARFRAGLVGPEAFVRNLRALSEHLVRQEGGSIAFSSTVADEARFLQPGQLPGTPQSPEPPEPGATFIVVESRAEVLGNLLAEFDRGALRPEQFRAFFLSSVTPAVVSARPLLQATPLNPDPRIPRGLLPMSEIVRRRNEFFQQVPRFEPLFRNAFEEDFFARLNRFNLPFVRFPTPPKSAAEVVERVAEVARVATSEGTSPLLRPTQVGPVSVILRGAEPAPVLPVPGGITPPTATEANAAIAALQRLTPGDAQQLLKTFTELDPIVNILVETDNPTPQNAVDANQITRLETFLGSPEMKGINADVRTIINVILALPEDSRLIAEQAFAAFLEGGVAVKEGLNLLQDTATTKEFNDEFTRLSDLLQQYLEITRLGIETALPVVGQLAPRLATMEARNFDKFEVNAALQRGELEPDEALGLLSLIDRIENGSLPTFTTGTLGGITEDDLSAVGEFGQTSWDAGEALAFAFAGAGALPNETPADFNARVATQRIARAANRAASRIGRASLAVPRAPQLPAAVVRTVVQGGAR